MTEKGSFLPSKEILPRQIARLLLLLLVFSYCQTSVKAESFSPPPGAFVELMLEVIGDPEFVDTFEAKDILGNEITQEIEANSDRKKRFISETGEYNTRVVSDKNLERVSQSLYDLNGEYSEYLVIAELNSYSKNDRQLNEVQIIQKIEQQQVHWSNVEAQTQAHHSHIETDGDITTITVENIDPVRSFGYQVKNNSNFGELVYYKEPYYNTPTIEFYSDDLSDFEIEIYDQTNEKNFQIQVKFGHTIPYMLQKKRTVVRFTPTLAYGSAMGTITDLDSGLSWPFSCLDSNKNGVIEGTETVFPNVPRSILYFPQIMAN